MVHHQDAQQADSLRDGQYGTAAAQSAATATEENLESFAPRAYGFVEAVMGMSFFGGADEHTGWDEHNVWACDDAPEQHSQRVLDRLRQRRGKRRMRANSGDDEPLAHHQDAQEADSLCEGQDGTAAAQPVLWGGDVDGQDDTAAAQPAPKPEQPSFGLFEAVARLGVFGRAEERDASAEDGAGASSARRLLERRLQQRRTRNQVHPVEAPQSEVGGAARFFEAVLSVGFGGGGEEHDIYHEDDSRESPARRLLHLRRQQRERKKALKMQAGEDPSPEEASGAADGAWDALRSMMGLGRRPEPAEQVPSDACPDASRDIANGWLSRARERLQQRRQRHRQVDTTTQDTPVDEPAGLAEEEAGSGFSMAWFLAVANPFGSTGNEEEEEEEEEYNIWGSEEEDVQKRTNAFKTARIAQERRWRKQEKQKALKAEGAVTGAGEKPVPDKAVECTGAAQSQGVSDGLLSPRESPMAGDAAAGSEVPPHLSASSTRRSSSSRRPSLCLGSASAAGPAQGKALAHMLGNCARGPSSPNLHDTGKDADAGTAHGVAGGQRKEQCKDVGLGALPGKASSARRPSRPSLYIGCGDLAAGRKRSCEEPQECTP